MNVESPGLGAYVQQLRDGQPFAFVRYGNGEWDCVLGLYHQTGSGSQRFTPDLRDALAQSLVEGREGRYYRAMQSTTYLRRVRILPRAESWLARNAPGIQWQDGEVFTKASMKGQLYPLVAAMSARQVVVVGPAWLGKLPFASAHVQVRAHDCWQDVGRIAALVRTYRDCVVTFSAGPTAKVLIHQLWPEMGEHSWLIDFGSLWDVYCDKPSRRYHKRITPAIRRRNMGG